jgi:chromate transporter
MMDIDLLLSIAQIFAKVSVVSVGGISVMIPEVHRQVVELNEWMNNAQFASVFALSQVAPGPNILLMSLVGWRVAGWAGMAVATMATILPTTILSVLANRLENKLIHAKWYLVTKKSLPPLIVGLIFSSGMVTAKATGLDALGLLIVACVAAHFYLYKSNPLVSIMVAMVVGVVAGWAGIL